MEDLNGMFFDKFSGYKKKKWPVWLYHNKDMYEPMKAKNKKEYDELLKQGYSKTRMRALCRAPEIINHGIDIENLNLSQLLYYIKKEFGLEISKKVSEEKLFKYIWRLSRAAPQNKDRMILLAQEVKLEYEATQAEIKRCFSDDLNKKNYEEDSFKEVFYA